MTSSFRQTRRAAIMIAGRWALFALAVSSTSAPAQLSDAFLATPKGQRLTLQERADLDLTQIAPDYRLHRGWLNCLNETARSSVGAGDSIEHATQLMSVVCEGGEGDLRASLAQSIGLARARRVIATLRENKLFEVTELHRKLRTPAKGVLSTVRGWSVVRSTDGCLAFQRTQGPLAAESTAIERRPAGFFLAMHSSGSYAQATRQTGPAKGLIILWKGFAATQYGEQVFTPIEVGNGAAVETPLGPKLLAVLGSYDKLQRGSGETVPIDGIDEVLGALERCFTKQ